MAKSSFKKRTHAVREDTPSVGRNNHSNNKQSKKKQKSTAKDDEAEFSVDPAELDRFAGSSEEEEEEENVDQDPNDVDEDLEDEDEVVPMKKLDNPEETDDDDSNVHDNGSSDDNDDNDRDGESERQTSTSKKRKPRNEKDTNDAAGANAHDGSSSSEDEDSPDEEIQTSSMGMANAMSRILGMGVVPQQDSTRKDGTTSAGTKPQQQQPIVLSKTITPLQRQAQKDKQEYQELLKRRKLNKEQKELTALHIPLLLTTTKKYQKDDKDDDDTHHQSHDSVAVELDRERLHRRVATRGVVALFNAIAQHQQQQQKQQQQQAGTTSSAATIGSQDPGNRSTVGTAQNKHAFLDQIKATAVAQGTTSKGTAPQQHSNPPMIVTATASTNQSSKPQWNALHDDFMLNPKKNWDQDDDDDEDDDDEP